MPLGSGKERFAAICPEIIEGTPGAAILHLSTRELELAIDHPVGETLPFLGAGE